LKSDVLPLLERVAELRQDLQQELCLNTAHQVLLKKGTPLDARQRQLARKPVWSGGALAPQSMNSACKVSWNVDWEMQGELICSS
jgi:hypothetical protein